MGEALKYGGDSNPVSVLGLRAPPALIATGPLRGRSSVVRVPALAASASA
ncbi:MAG: hypothetical protein ACI8RZ_007811, partial [Myxococcota bacterium]